MGELPDDWKYPNWEQKCRVHDWKNYISEKLESLWVTFNDELKKVIAENANEYASREDCD